MTAYFKAAFRHFQLARLGGLLFWNILTVLPLFATLAGPLLLRDSPTAGLIALLCGMLLTGQAVAVAGRYWGRKWEGRGVTPWSAWRAAWADGLVLSALFLGLFSLLFESLPFYWAQGTAFAWFSIGTLALGTVLLLGLLPYWLPARRSGLSLPAAFRSAFQLMNGHPLTALATFGLGAVFFVCSLGTFGLFPGFTGLAAFHQGIWDRLNGAEGERVQIEGGAGRES